MPDDTGNAPAETGDVTGDTEGGETGEAPTAPEGPVQEPQTFDALIASEPETELTLMSVEDAGLDQQAVTSLESSGETGDMSIMASALAPVIDTPENVVAVLVGAGVTYSNVGYTGAQVSLGTFTGGTGIVGFEDGVILGSGDITDVVGPNNSGGTGTNNGEPGDDDLSTLAGDDTYDAAVLTFDFVPAGNQIVFNYVFSSEEYNEYVNEGFNDVFAFYVNGENCALVNGGAVSIDTINNGSNADLYVDNTDAHLNTGMDGLTVVLTCTANVNPGATNTMKLAIADSGDSILDSNVFIQAKSFVVPTPTPSTTPETPAPSPTATEVPGTPVPTETAGKPHKHYKSYKAYVEDCEDPVPAVALTYTSTSTGGTVKALPSTGAGSEQDGSTNLLVIAATIGAGVSLTGAIATSRNGREA